MFDITPLNLLECFIFPLLSLGTYIPTQISSWDNTLSFLNRKNYLQWDYGDHYTITSSRYVDCGSYNGKDLQHFVNKVGTNYIVVMFVFYFVFTTAAVIFGTIGSLFRYFSLENSIYHKKRFRIFKGIANFMAFCCSVPSFYAFKIHYGDCITVTGDLDWLLNDTLRELGNAGFWLFLFCPCLCSITCRGEGGGWCYIAKLVMFGIIMLFFAEAVAINTMFLVVLQVPWNIYLFLDSLFQIFLVCSR